MWELSGMDIESFEMWVCFRYVNEVGYHLFWKNATEGYRIETHQFRKLDLPSVNVKRQQSHHNLKTYHYWRLIQ